MAELAPGSTIGTWRIERVVGRGGMGVVYEATDLKLHRPVAIKVIAGERAEDPLFRDRFEREARLAASLDHPNVIPVYAAGEDDGHLYIAMRFVSGTDLEDLLRRDGPLPPERAAEIVSQVAEALDAAHAAGLVHRDVKPANVLMAGRHVYLGDFGLSRAVDAASAQHITDTGERLGTVDFMSPEQLRGRRTDARSDVYALGCLLFTLLAGTPPFHRATPAATVSAHLEDPIPRLPTWRGMPPRFDDVLARALAKDPADRYPSAGDLGRAAIAATSGKTPTDQLRSVARGEAAPDQAETVALGATTKAIAGTGETRPTVTIQRRNMRHPGRELAVIGTLLVAGGVAVAIALNSGGGGEDPNGPLSSGEVADTARAFARAYAHEDTRALRRLLATDVERVSTADRQRGRTTVINEYRDQFKANATRDYKLAGLTASGGSAGRAAAAFTVTRTGRPPIVGQVVFGVARVRGEPRIRLIATETRS